MSAALLRLRCCCCGFAPGGALTSPPIALRRAPINPAAAAVPYAAGPFFAENDAEPPFYEPSLRTE